MKGLFPNRCAGCGLRGEELCSRCLASISPLGLDCCPQCAGPSRAGRLCRRCLAGRGQLKGIRAATIFNGVVRQAVLGLKYRHRRGLAQPLASLIAGELLRRPLELDLLVPVPLHPARLKARGYNQAELLARSLGELLGKPVSLCLARSRDTRSQVELKAAGRVANVRGAFEYAGTDPLSGQRIGLVDDVATTGATLMECAGGLVAAGAGPVWGIVVAREL